MALISHESMAFPEGYEIGITSSIQLLSNQIQYLHGSPNESRSGKHKKGD